MATQHATPDPTPRPRATLLPAVALLLVVALLLAGCGGPAPVPLRFGDAPWQPGEASRYRLLDNGADAGSALYAVAAETIDGSAGWAFRRETSGAGGAEIVAVLMGAQGFRPSAAFFRITDATGSEAVNATYGSGGQVDLELISKRQVTTYERKSVPTDTRDQRSLPLIVRALPLAQGYATQINTFLPYTGRLERYTVRVRGREQVSVPAGTFDAWNVELDNGSRSVHYWIGVDPPHPLVKIEDANIVYELEFYEPE